ncbi:LysR substrate-binding domain-containing protein [Candidimonas nitroreducens]|uniref:LysR family transcriptional regulator n=1 Tax=Candidimonas nitroreducens TaxID=683354 RepID=A0A225M851_9BURK|nr:LysR substrate-binding domain-containing protein [Candidimonas nitroreducens]OWT57448.1 LysR family transcriptional regulator [Candidimonas nitroreducens]
MVNFRLIRHLFLFLAVAEELHFGRAAKRLGMSQPPLSEQIRVLENALRVRLFVRTPKGVQLTPVGTAILPAVSRFAEQLERLESAVREAVAGRTGVLTIGAIASSMLDYLPPLVERIKAAHPQLTISVKEIDSAEAVPALEAGDIDLAFARLEGDPSPTIRSIPMVEDRLAVALPRGHGMAASENVKLGQLAEEDFVMFSRRLSPIYFDNVTAACRANGFSPRILHEVRSVASQIAFVSCGQGVALVPYSLRKLAPQNVAVRPLKEEIRVVTTAMAWSAVGDNALVQTILSDLGIET